MKKSSVMFIYISDSMLCSASHPQSHQHRNNLTSRHTPV